MTYGAVFADSAADSAAESARSSIASDGIRLMTHGAVVPTRRPQSRQKPLRVSSALVCFILFNAPRGLRRLSSPGIDVSNMLLCIHNELTLSV
jgi:hypothetical protein